MSATEDRASRSSTGGASKGALAGALALPLTGGCALTGAGALTGACALTGAGVLTGACALTGAGALVGRGVASAGARIGAGAAAATATGAGAAAGAGAAGAAATGAGAAGAAVRRSPICASNALTLGCVGATAVSFSNQALARMRLPSWRHATPPACAIRNGELPFWLAVLSASDATRSQLPYFVPQISRR